MNMATLVSALDDVSSVNVLGVKVACIQVQGMLDLVGDWSEQTARRTICYVNAHCLNVAYVDEEYRCILNQADLVYSDGVGVVWAGSFLRGRRLYKITGADWINDFCERATLTGLRVYLLGGKPGIIQLAEANLLKRWPGLKVVGICDGYFSAKSEDEVLREIAEVNPHIVFVGRGTPRQEKWIADHRHQIAAPVCWAVGALFDYVAGVERRAPAWMNALALEWFWRLMVDPLGKWRRYILGNPSFILRIIRQKYGYSTWLDA